jgi:hypothetical protein
LVDNHDIPEREGLRRGRFTGKDPEVFSGFFPLLGVQKEVGQVLVSDKVFGIECEGFSICLFGFQETAFLLCFTAFFQGDTQVAGQTIQESSRGLAGQKKRPKCEDQEGYYSPHVLVPFGFKGGNVI